MSTTITNKFVIRGAIAGLMAAPALLFLAQGAAQAAVPGVSESHASTITTQRPGHVAIHVEPPMVSAPLVWGAFDSPQFIVGD